MVEKRYDWVNGAELGDHSRRKHKILRDYFSHYLAVRCQLPQQSRFRIAIVDGFAGGGIYACGSPGSPLIFLNELKRNLRQLNAQRTARSFANIEFECILILNDSYNEVIKILKKNIAPLQAVINSTVPELKLRVEYFDEPFENAYPKIKALLSKGRFRNVLFNLDQSGHSHVNRDTLVDIMSSFRSAEVFYTFAIDALVSFLHRTDTASLMTQLSHIGIERSDLKCLEGTISSKKWLGKAERLVFESFRGCAPFVSPFSINNPDGWRYWFIHLANSYRARQVYNNILHRNSCAQAHFGRSGLNMLYYDPREDNCALYLFDDFGREIAKSELLYDIPRLISESDDVMNISDFYQSIYNNTPAHADDIHSAIIQCPDVEVITANGGLRRKPNTIAAGDLLKLKRQRSFFPLFQKSSK